MLEQDRLSRCRRCDELKGQALIEQPGQRLIYVPVTCICKGIACRICRRKMVRRPISNRFDGRTGTVWHMPWLGAVAPCASCRQRRKSNLAAQNHLMERSG